MVKTNSLSIYSLLLNKDGSVPLKVTYPKFKNEEATVRNLKIKPIFGIYLLSFVE